MMPDPDGDFQAFREAAVEAAIQAAAAQFEPDFTTSPDAFARTAVDYAVLKAYMRPQLAAPQAPAEPTEEDFAATLDGLNEQARVLRNLPAPQLAARRDAATPDDYNDDERFEFLRGPCSCQPVRTWIHASGTYCGDTQYEQAVDSMRAKTGRPGDERDEEAVSAVLGYPANPTPEEKQ